MKKIEKSKCPKNPKVEVVWKPKEEGLGGGIVCSYSNETNCRKCIERGEYPKK